LAALASRSSLFAALLRTASPVNIQSLIDFLRGLSRDELECLADFQGACMLEQEYSKHRQRTESHPYRLMADFFDPVISERWRHPDDRAHKVFIVLGYLDRIQPSVSIRIAAGTTSPQPGSLDNKHSFNNS
jgi:hypothetical protein